MVRRERLAVAEAMVVACAWGMGWRRRRRKLSLGAVWELRVDVGLRVGARGRIVRSGRIAQRTRIRLVRPVMGIAVMRSMVVMVLMVLLLRKRRHGWGHWPWTPFSLRVRRREGARKAW